MNYCNAKTKQYVLKMRGMPNPSELLNAPKRDRDEGTCVKCFHFTLKL